LLDFADESGEGDFQAADGQEQVQGPGDDRLGHPTLPAHGDRRIDR
jgi:hypothetical protein